MGYTKDTIKGISWIGFLRFFTKLIGFVEVIILARILSPAQFGAYSVALLALGLLEVTTETGVNVVLIQEDDIDKHIDSAWIISIVRGVIISIILLISTPFIVTFFHANDASTLLYFISIVPILRGFINPAVVKFQKDLLFKSEFQYRFIILIVDTIVSIGVTYITRSPIGIIVGLISGVAIELILSFYIVSSSPHIQRLSVRREYLAKIIHRGKWVTGSGIFNYLFHNADNIVVGRLLNTSALGAYQIAYSLAILPITEIADVFSKVTFPVFKKVSSDKVRLRKAFLKTVASVSIITIPFGFIMYFFPDVIVSTIFGSKWMVAIPILPVLGVFGVVRAISGTSSALFLSVGKQEYVTYITLVSFLGLIIPIVPLVTRYGIMGAAVAALIGSIVALPFMGFYTWKIFYNYEKS